MERADVFDVRQGAFVLDERIAGMSWEGKYDEECLTDLRLIVCAYLYYLLYQVG